MLRLRPPSPISKTSATYGFATPYKGKAVTSFGLTLTPKLATAKREFAEERKIKRLDRKYPFSQRLRVDLEAVSFAPLLPGR